MSIIFFHLFVYRRNDRIALVEQSSEDKQDTWRKENNVGNKN